MSFGSIPFGHGTFGGTGLGGATSGSPVVTTPEVVIDPFTIELAGVSMKGHQLINSLSMDFELGRQGTARFSLYNIPISPEIGAPVRILYYSERLFVGAVDRITVKSNNQQTFIQYDFECTDNSYLLFRKKVKANLTTISVSGIAYYIIGSALLDDNVTLGTVDNNITIPSAVADGVSAFEFLNGVAIAAGLVFYIDKDKALNFIGSSQVPAPHALDQDTVNDCSIELDRETYRNRQATTVTGTPQVEGQTALSVTLMRDNTEQQEVRASIEGGSGIYSDIASITHPTSNTNLELVRLANAYNKILLALTGSIRQSLSVTTRQVGFEAGQVASVDLPQVGATGDWIIRRVSLREESGRFLISSLQLSQTSLMRRAQELWVEVVRKGTLSILPPSATYTSGTTITSTGSGSWQVPDGITDVQVSLYGSGGGGGGGANSNYTDPFFLTTAHRVADGASGGSGGLVIKVLSVTPGTVITYWVGAGGAGGAESYRANSAADAIGATGGNGIETYIQINGTKVARAYGGHGGLGGWANAVRSFATSYPPGGSQGGLGGDAITVGGAGTGRFGGVGPSANGSGGGDGTAGANGRIIFEW